MTTWDDMDRMYAQLRLCHQRSGDGLEEAAACHLATARTYLKRHLKGATA